MKMYNNPLHSDVSIVVGNSRIAAHRQVLATHSKVFQRMWEHDLREVQRPTCLSIPQLWTKGIVH